MDLISVSLGNQADEFVAAAAAAIPLARLAEPLEIARPVLFPASEDASCATGAELVSDGCYVAASLTLTVGGRWIAQSV